MNQNRVPEGVPTGGQFAASARDESLVALGDAGSYLHDSAADCIADGSHLTSCDDDGYCNVCGEQSIEVVPSAVQVGDVVILDGGDEVVINAIETYKNDFGGNGYRISTTDGQQMEFDHETYFGELVGRADPDNLNSALTPSQKAARSWLVTAPAEAKTSDGTSYTANVEVSSGQAGFTLVGRLRGDLADGVDARVRALIEDAGYEYPVGRRVTVLLSPADIEKDTNCDRQIAAQIVRASGQGEMS